MISRVACIHCPDYDPVRVEEAVARGLELLGGAAPFAGQSLLLKPNLLAADPPERCSATHPMVFRGVAKALLAAGCRLQYGDSPAVHRPATAAERSGMAAVGRELGIPLADFETRVEKAHPGGVRHKRCILASAAADAIGAIVNLPKFKTHGLTRMTCAVKNLFGCVPGILKSEYHVKLPDAFQFSRMLVDLNGLLQPRLHVLDGILAMEGNGPRGGRPKPMHVLMLSADPVALDATAARLIDLNPEFIPTVVFGREQGLGTFLESEIELVGDPWEKLRPRHFQAVRRPIEPPAGASQKARWLKNLLVPKPKIRSSWCTRCGTCVAICPVEPKALAWPEGGPAPSGSGRKPVPIYDYDRCIRCYCCQELCPEKAIRVHTPLLRRLLPFI